MFFITVFALSLPKSASARPGSYTSTIIKLAVIQPTEDQNQSRRNIFYIKHIILQIYIELEGLINEHTFHLEM